MNKLYKSIMKKNPWVQAPQIPKVQSLLNTITPVNFSRGSGIAKKRLDLLEQQYREWVKDIIDLSEFNYCYFVNGVTDALNQWIATETRPWQYLQGDYEYARMIGGDASCEEVVQPDKLLYISNPACATGNFINIDKIKNSVIKNLVITDTIDNISKTKNVKNIEVLSISALMGEAIKRISNSTSCLLYTSDAADE